jgi:antitoxin PrlF
MTAIAKVTSKGQITIPQEIRKQLQVKSGDLIAWETTPEGAVLVRRVLPIDVEYLRAVQSTLEEWSSKADEEAYGNL